METWCSPGCACLTVGQQCTAAAVQPACRRRGAKRSGSGTSPFPCWQPPACSGGLRAGYASMYASVQTSCWCLWHNNPACRHHHAPAAARLEGGTFLGSHHASHPTSSRTETDASPATVPASLLHPASSLPPTRLPPCATPHFCCCWRCRPGCWPAPLEARPQPSMWPATPRMGAAV